MPEQHDDHIWLNVGGSAWAIYSLHGPVALLWRGYYPDFEFNAVNLAGVDWEAYAQKSLDFLYPSAPEPGTDT